MEHAEMKNNEGNINSKAKLVTLYPAKAGAKLIVSQENKSKQQNQQPLYIDRDTI